MFVFLDSLSISLAVIAVCGSCVISAIIIFYFICYKNFQKDSEPKLLTYKPANGIGGIYNHAYYIHNNKYYLPTDDITRKVWLTKRYTFNKGYVERNIETMKNTHIMSKFRNELISKTNDSEENDDNIIFSKEELSKKKCDSGPEELPTQKEIVLDLNGLVSLTDLDDLKPSAFEASTFRKEQLFQSCYRNFFCEHEIFKTSSKVSVADQNMTDESLQNTHHFSSVVAQSCPGSPVNKIMTSLQSVSIENISIETPLKTFPKDKIICYSESNLEHARDFTAMHVKCRTLSEVDQQHIDSDQQNVDDCIQQLADDYIQQLTDDDIQQNADDGIQHDTEDIVQQNTEESIQKNSAKEHASSISLEALTSF